MIVIGTSRSGTRRTPLSAKILVIDDNEALALMLQIQLEHRGYEVVTALSGIEGLQAAYEAQPALIILDIMMPDIDGWEVCRRLRGFSNVPIIMLTVRAANGDVVRGLQSGADDYVTKPFDEGELDARIRAVLRRYDAKQSGDDSSSVTFDDGYLRIDLERRMVTVGGEAVDLTPTEFDLLSCLVQYEGRVVTHQHIMTEVWGPQYVNRTDYVKLYIRYLRSKIEQDASEPYYIRTEWGQGYYFNFNTD